MDRDKYPGLRAPDIPTQFPPPKHLTLRFASPARQPVKNSDLTRFQPGTLKPCHVSAWTMFLPLIQKVSWSKSCPSYQPQQQTTLLRPDNHRRASPELGRLDGQLPESPSKDGQCCDGWGGGFGSYSPPKSNLISHCSEILD